MTTQAEVTAAFRADLNALLLKYGASLEADDHYRGYAEWGSDIRITVVVPSEYGPDNNLTREYTEIDLGRSAEPTPA